MPNRRTLTRADLAEAAYRAGGVTMRDAGDLVDELLRQIAGELVTRGETHAIPATSRVAFRASPELRARVNGKEGGDA